MIENSVQPSAGQPPVISPPVSPPKTNMVPLVVFGFFITLVVMVPLLFFTQFPKKTPAPVIVSSTPTPSVAFSAESFLLPTNTPNPTQIALTPLPAPTTLLKEQYDNPFGTKTQAVNPFGTVNPFDTLAQ